MLFCFLNNKNLILNKAQHIEGTKVKAIWGSQQKALQLEGNGFKQWSPLSRQTLSKSWVSVWSPGRQEESSGRIFLQETGLSSWFQDFARLGRV